MDADAIRKEIDQARVVVRSLRNHARTTAAYLADLEERLEQHLTNDPPVEGDTGTHEQHKDEAKV